jgi:hypothetical protein
MPQPPQPQIGRWLMNSVARLLRQWSATAQRLAERAESAAGRSGKRVSSVSDEGPQPTPPLVAAAQPGEAPAHWAEHVRRGPPQHWLELVRERAPGLLEADSTPAADVDANEAAGTPEPSPRAPRPALETEDGRARSAGGRRPARLIPVPRPRQPVRLPVPEVAAADITPVEAQPATAGRADRADRGLTPDARGSELKPKLVVPRVLPRAAIRVRAPADSSAAQGDRDTPTRGRVDRSPEPARSETGQSRKQLPGAPLPNTSGRTAVQYDRHQDPAQKAIGQRVSTQEPLSEAVGAMRRSTPTIDADARPGAMSGDAARLAPQPRRGEAPTPETSRSTLAGSMQSEHASPPPIPVRERTEQPGARSILPVDETPGPASSDASHVPSPARLEQSIAQVRSMAPQPRVEGGRDDPYRVAPTTVAGAIPQTQEADHRWPDLPSLDTEEGEEVGIAHWQGLQRAIRLDHEQRGRLWNESLS